MHLTCTLMIVLNPVMLLHLYQRRHDAAAHTHSNSGYCAAVWQAAASRMDACMALPLLQLALLFQCNNVTAADDKPCLSCTEV